VSETLEEPGQEIIIHESAVLSVTPQVEAGELVARIRVIREAMEQAMERDVDYGVIPGTGSKPTLLKPGAEKLGALFQLDVQLENEKMWHEDGHLTVVSKATVFHQPTGARLGAGEGICTTREGRYAFRTAGRVCPRCGSDAIIKGKAEYGGGWVCFKKKGGCGSKFPDDAPSIVSQETGKVPNENIADTYNTVDKMASKRARIDAVLAVTGASALFTQDIEDTAAPSETQPVAQPTSEGPSREQKMRDRILELCDTIDKDRGTDEVWAFAEIERLIAWRHDPDGNIEPYSSATDWDTCTEDDLEYLGKELSNFIEHGCQGSLYENARVPF